MCATSEADVILCSLSMAMDVDKRCQHSMHAYYTSIKHAKLNQIDALNRAFEITLNNVKSSINSNRALRIYWAACMQVSIVNATIQHSNNKFFEALCSYGV